MRVAVKRQPPAASASRMRSRPPGGQDGGDAGEEVLLRGGRQVVEDVEEQDGVGTGQGGVRQVGGLDLGWTSQRLAGHLRGFDAPLDPLEGEVRWRRRPGGRVDAALALRPGSSSREKRMPRPQPRSSRRPPCGRTPWRRRWK